MVEKRTRPTKNDLHEQHMDPEQLKELEDQVTLRTETKRQTVSDNEDKHQKWLEEPVTFDFINTETPGLSITFTVGTTRRSQKIKLEHGKRYTYPRWVMRHILECKKPINDYRPDGEGNMVPQFIGYEPRFNVVEVFDR